MKILVINAGSSSLKFRLIESKNFRSLCRGIVDGIGLKTCRFIATNGTKEINNRIQAKDYQQALKLTIDFLLKTKIVKNLKEIQAVGHRIVHGGEKHKNATIISPAVLKTIQKLCDLAPLHNPPNLAGIKACQKLIPHTKQVAVFDTAFHQTLPEKAYLYALPYSFYKKMGIRRYGFHGTSHAYVAAETLKLLQKQNSKIITCHLGNGSSITAIHNGKSVDTSMGFTPLEGVPMGTRSGDIDPALSFHLIKSLKKSPQKIADIFNKESGLKGLSEISSDVRDLWAKAQKNNPKAKRALSVFAYRIAKYIGAYTAVLQGLDALTFTAGIGQNAYYLRAEICHYLGYLGLKLDPQKNRRNALTISNTKSKVKVYVIPTNEERQIAIETAHALKK